MKFKDIKYPKIIPYRKNRWEDFFLKVAGVEPPKPLAKNMFMNKAEFEKTKKTV